MPPTSAAVGANPGVGMVFRHARMLAGVGGGNRGTQSGMFGRSVVIGWPPGRVRAQTGRMLSMLEMGETGTGVRLRNAYGWHGWTIEVDLDLRDGRVVALRDIAPLGTRSNARRPCDDADLVNRLTQAAQMRYGWLSFVAAALPSPHRKKPNGVQLRAATIAIMWELAKDQGLSPRRAISAVYGLPVIDEGERTEYSPTLKRWIKQARETVNPQTGRPYLPTYDHERDAPRRWPGSDGRGELEPRRAGPMVPEPVREGPFAGRTLTLRVTRTPPPPRELGDRGRRTVGPDLVVEGRWDDGAEMPREEPLRAVSPDQAPHRVLALIAELEARYPGAKITASRANVDAANIDA